MDAILLFLNMNSGALVSIGGAVAVAAITAYGAVRARRTREPTSVKDAWDENRLTRAEADSERAASIALERRVAYQGNALVVLWRYCQRLVASWGQPEMPELTQFDRATIERVIEDVSTPPEGTRISF